MDSLFFSFYTVALEDPTSYNRRGVVTMARVKKPPTKKSNSKSALSLVQIDRGPKRRFQLRLLKWYDEHGRDLPWRRTVDPYKILVSEVMLVLTVYMELPRRRWLATGEKFPMIPMNSNR